MNECKKCNVTMEQGYTIVNDNLYGGLKIVKQQKEFENLKDKIYGEICPQCDEV